MKNKKTLFLLILFLAHALSAGEPRTQDPSRVESPPKAKVGRAFLELGINLAVSTVNYWQKYTQFIEDWQFTLTWKDQKRKFFTSEGLRLDSNNLRLNWTHAWAGGLYYNWGRSNHFTPLGSFLFSLGGSFFWEYIAEWREVASINDMVFTAAGGPAIGEPLFQIASHFRSRPGFFNRIACLLVNPVLGINDAIDGRNGEARTPTREWADLRFSLGGKRGPESPADHSTSHAHFDLDLRRVTLPGYGRAGSGSGYSRRPIDNGYRISFSFNERLVEEFQARTRIVMAGWWWKHVRVRENGERHGAELWLGPVMGWDFFQKKPVVPYDGDDLGMTQPWFEREQPTRYTDKRSSMHLIGPAFNLTAYAGRLAARLDLEASADFSMIHSLAYNDYSAGHDVWGVKTTLHNWGYYYSLGYSLAGRFDLSRGPWRLEANVRYQRFHSIQGLDRFQDDLLDDARLADSRLEYGAGLSAAIGRTPFFLSLNLEGVDRWGRFHEVERSHHELRLFYRLGVSF